jgi:putative transposase
MPHHVTQRGNRRQQTFFRDEDYAAYVELMAEWCGEEGVEIWGYCLMPNHAHLIAVPASDQGLRRAIGEAHRRYTRRIHFRLRELRGHSRTGRPLGADTFLERLESFVGHVLRPQKGGRPRKQRN